jgi:hypothetical protein
MKTTLIVLLCFLFNFAVAVHPISGALSEIVDKFLSKDSKTIWIVTRSNKNSKIRRISSEIAKSSNVSYEMMDFDVKGITKPVDTSGIFLFRDFKSYKNFLFRIERLYHKKLHFFIYINNLNGKDVSRSIKSLSRSPNSSLNRKYFLVHDASNPNMFNLITFVMFKEHKCREWTAFNVNQYSVKGGRWETNKFSMEKFHDFEGCELQVLTPLLKNVELLHKFDENGTLVGTKGPIHAMHQIISKRLNYTYNYNPYFLEESAAYNESLKSDFALFSTSYHKLRTINLNGKLTWPHTSVDTVVLFSRFKPYTQYEKIFLPFDTEVWYCLIGMLLFFASVIILLKFASKSVRDFVIGSKVRTPLLNMV